MSDTHKADLFELIKLMTMSEKRYFKLFAARHTIGGKNNHIRLFDAIEKQTRKASGVYDEKRLIQTEDYLSQFAVIKKNLYDLILKALSLYNYDSSRERDIYNILNHIEFLYNKGLFRQCEKALERADMMATKINRSRFKLIINNWKLRLFVSQDYMNTTPDYLKKLERENSDIISHLKLQEKLTYLNAKIHNTIRITGVVRDSKIKNKIRSLYEEITKLKQPEESNFISLFYYYNVHYLYYYSLIEFNKAYNFITKILDLFEKYPHYKSENNEMFLNTVFNKIGLENNLLDFKRALESIKYLKTLEAVSVPLKNHLLFRTVIYELSVYCLSVNFKDGYARLKQLNDFFTSPQLKNINISTWHIIHYQAAFICIGSKQYKQAIMYLNKIVNRPSVSESRNDIVCYSKILLLLCYYELGDTEHIEYAVKSAYRYLLKREKLFAFERAILQFIKKMPSLSTKQLTIKAFGMLKAELERLLNDTYERGAMEYFDFISWLESKIYNKSFDELIKDKFLTGYYNR